MQCCLAVLGVLEKDFGDGLHVLSNAHGSSQAADVLRFGCGQGDWVWHQRNVVDESSLHDLEVAGG